MALDMRSSSGMTDSATCTYDSAVTALNRLQSNAATIEQSLRERDSKCEEKLPEMVAWAAKLGITQADYNSLRVIHVTGTKGKGGTSAYAESILRCHGYRTGFYSSPHLVEVRERIRINGRPLSRQLFAEQFWDVYNRLGSTTGSPLPAYFPFLTLMAVKVFLAEKVDVAIVEVGIGGRYDSTNFLTRPWLCAFSPLGLDHTALLGNTIADIAWQKAGIMKPSCVAVTVPDQPPEGLAVLKSEAANLNCPLSVAPLLQSPLGEEENAQDRVLLPDCLLAKLAPSQVINASLAVEVCRLWLQRAAATETDQWAEESAAPHRKLQLDPSTSIRALADTRWPGRFDVMPYRHRPGVTLYIDGAHTVESVAHAAAWFRKSSSSSSNSRRLLFNRTGDRRPSDLLAQLKSLGFSRAAFCPNIVGGESSSGDLFNALASSDSAGTRKRVEENLLAFQQLDEACQCRAFDTLTDALDWLIDDDGEGCDVLITGSLHLVGCLYSKLSPEIATGSV